MKSVFITSICLLPITAVADVIDDFEAGSGGINLTVFELLLQYCIFILMCVFVAWVLVSNLKEIAGSKQFDYYVAASEVLRAFFLFLLIALTLT